MRATPIPLCIALPLFLSSLAHGPFLGPATAQTQTKSQSKEALYVKCRNAIFRKYGQSGLQYGIGPGYRVLPYTAGSWIDQCVANGGRVH
jgi:hypothetical protein